MPRKPKPASLFLMALIIYKTKHGKATEKVGSFYIRPLFVIEHWNAKYVSTFKITNQKHNKLHY